ncbi:MAG: aldo/keto reductase [Candidatus Binataceae bacterium]
MLKGRATAEASAAYASRFPKLPGSLRPMLGLSVSSIGIGTYLGDPDAATDAEYEAALTAALAGGINLVDTAVNYRFQRSERTIGKVLAAMTAAGTVKREEIVVATKGGYITFDGEVPPNPRGWFEEHYVRTGIVAPGDLVEGSHCMTPKWLTTMLEMSRANLGLETIDIYYIHNPETQLGEVSRTEFLTRMRAAFETLEGAVTAGKIGVYGIATWNGLRAPATERGFLSLDELWRLAHEVAADAHHFRAIQLPYNLAMPEAVTRSNQTVGTQKGTALTVAGAMGLGVCASASLLQGRLAKGLPEIMNETFPDYSSDAQRSIQFVRSTPGVNVALVGMKSVEHVRDTLAAASRPPAGVDELMKLFRPADQSK